MRPMTHLGFALLGAAPAYLLSGSAVFTACFALAEVGVDVDHLVDHVLFSRRPLRIWKLMEKNIVHTSWRKLVFFLHSHELLALGWLAAWQIGAPWALGLASGWLVHMVLDEIGNRSKKKDTIIPPWFYLLSFRMAKGFEIKQMCTYRRPIPMGPAGQAGDTVS